MQRPRAGALVDNKAAHLHVGHGQIRRLKNGVEFLPSGSKFRSTGNGVGVAGVREAQPPLGQLVQLMERQQK